MTTTKTLRCGRIRLAIRLAMVHNRRMPVTEEPHDKRLVRGEPVVKRVLTATIEEIALTGYDGLTLERVAARAGVNRTTIYRRWPTKKDLVAATMRFASEQVVFDWDHGSLRADLAQLLERARETFFAPGMLGMHRLIIEAHADPDLCGIARCSRDEKHDRAIEMLERAEERGELRPDLDKELFLDGMFGAIFSLVVFQGQPITPAFTDRLLDHLMKVASPAKAARAPSRRPRARKATAKVKPAPRRRLPARS
jgi:AcrR family transcriptional regulator